MRWPWQHDIEVRAADYTDSLIALLAQRAQGSDAIGDVGATAALEACSGTRWQGVFLCRHYRH